MEELNGSPQNYMLFTFGFKYKRYYFGWHNEELYRLPTVSHGKVFGLKKLKRIAVGKKEGYELRKVKRTVEQCLRMTKEINRVVSVPEKHKDLPSILT